MDEVEQEYTDFPDVTEEVKQLAAECDHTFKLASQGFRKTESYICTKCGETKSHRWYD